MICILHGFPCEMDFSHHESRNPTRVACDECGILRQVVRNPSHMEKHTNWGLHKWGKVISMRENINSYLCEHIFVPHVLQKTTIDVDVRLHQIIWCDIPGI